MSKKIVKLEYQYIDPVTKKEGSRELYHFEIDRKHFDQFDMELITNPKNRKSNFLLNSFTGKISKYSPPVIEKGNVKEDGKWVEEELSKDSFHALIQSEEWGMVCNAAIAMLGYHYGGASVIEDFLE